MPDLGIEFARRENVESGTSSDNDIGDDKSMVMLGHIFVDGAGEKLEIPVEEQYDEESEDGPSGKLGDGAHLEREKKRVSPFSY